MKFGWLIALSALLLPACDEPSVIHRCWNPRLLRVKFGQEVFDLPKSVQDPFSSKDQDRAGILLLPYGEYSADDRNRRYCNDKQVPFPRVVARSSLMRMQTDVELVESLLFQIKTEGFESDLIGDESQIDRIRLLRRIDIKSNGGDALFDFELDGRVRRVECFRAKTFADNDGSRIAFVHRCTPLWVRFRSIAIGVQNTGLRTGASLRIIPPEEWPKQIKYVVDKLKSYRVANPQGEFHDISVQ